MPPPPAPPGKSSGGILLHAALCRSAAVRRARGVVDILGGLPEAMAASCSPAGGANFLLIHGVKDEHLPFNRGALGRRGGAGG